MSSLWRATRSYPKKMNDTKTYWEQRYKQGWEPHPNKSLLRAYKADIINTFIYYRGIKSVLDLGCGEGTQATKLSQAFTYTGADVSESALEKARHRNPDKTFIHLPADLPTADATLSLDVIYHLVEEPYFEEYMNLLFDQATRYVIIYSSNPHYGWPPPPPHIRHWDFASWVEKNKPEWKLCGFERNPYPYHEGANEHTTSWSDFYFYQHQGER